MEGIDYIRNLFAVEPLATLYIMLLVVIILSAMSYVIFSSIKTMVNYISHKLKSDLTS